MDASLYSQTQEVGRICWRCSDGLAGIVAEILISPMNQSGTGVNIQGMICLPFNLCRASCSLLSCLAQWLGLAPVLQMFQAPDSSDNSLGAWPNELNCH